MFSCKLYLYRRDNQLSVQFNACLCMPYYFNLLPEFTLKPSFLQSVFFYLFLMYIIIYLFHVLFFQFITCIIAGRMYNFKKNFSCKEFSTYQDQWHTPELHTGRMQPLIVGHLCRIRWIP